jgi:plastocyanin
VKWLDAALIATALCLLQGTGCRGGDPPGNSAGSGPAAAQHLQAEAGGGGSISPAGTGVFRGRVVLDGPRPGRKKVMVVKDVAVCGKIDHVDDRLVVGDGGGIMNAVVSIHGVKGGRKCDSMGKEFVLDQRGCAYNPHVLLIPVGEKLKVLNNDGVLHNIHTYSTINPAFNIAQPKVLRELDRKFSAPERISVRCDVHGWMSSWVIVVDQPYNAVTDENGNFEIEGVPPGTYTVECWQEELGEQTAVITMDGSTAQHNFTYISTYRSTDAQ